MNQRLLGNISIDKELALEWYHNRKQYLLNNKFENDANMQQYISSTYTLEHALEEDFDDFLEKYGHIGNAIKVDNVR